MLRAFLEVDDLEPARCLKHVFCSGEALPLDLQERFFARLEARLHNLYGPTEAAIDVTSWACRRTDGARSVPIGRPIANTQIYVVDGRFEPVPIGAPGELLIGGIQVARGYHDRPDLTAERFVPDPFARQSGSRLYRTGDLARYGADGTVEFIGRMDHQVKIRGFRIELGEIETSLHDHPDVREAVVVVQEGQSGETGLVAYVVSAGSEEPEPEALRSLVGRASARLHGSLGIRDDAVAAADCERQDRPAVTAATGATRKRRVARRSAHVVGADAVRDLVAGARRREDRHR